jgi:hypothetical protein
VWNNEHYSPGYFLMLRSDYVKDLGVRVNVKCKCHFHLRVDLLLSDVMKLLGLIRSFIFTYSYIEALL